MGQAIQKAREDEESQSRLAASLRANIPAWDGNTKAIEAVILARQKLGFTDEEQRKSLALLVAATHDVNKALEINRTAMDLARLKGISLEEASSALVKVEGGQYRALKALGIILPKNATAQDALNAVQKVATGQAEEYAKTSEGKLLVSQIKISEALEKLGYVILPAVTDALTFAGGAADTLSTLLDVLNGKLPSTVQGQFDLGKGLLRLAASLPGVGPQYGILADQMDKASAAMAASTAASAQAGNASSTMAAHVHNAGDNIGGAATNIKKAFVRIRDASGNAKARIAENARDIAAAIKTLRTKLVAEAQALIDGYYDPIIAADDLRVQKDTVVTDQIAVNEARAALAKTKAGSVERKQAQLTLDQALATQHASQQALDTTRLNLLASGKLSAKEQKTWLADLQAKYKTATGDAKTKIGELIAKIKELQGISGAKVNISTSFKIGGKATGGPVTAGTPYWVNENTPNSEIWVPSVSGKVLSGAVPVAAAGGGGNTYNIPVTVAAQPPARDPLAIARTLGRYARSGLLIPEPPR